MMFGFPDKKNKATYLYDFNCKDDAIREYLMQFYNRSLRMFDWQGLPDTIPQRSLELGLQHNGYMAIARYSKDDNLYCLYGGLGGELDQNYMPTRFVFANPWLKWSGNLRIGEECIVIPSDSMYRGLNGIYRKYATLLCENDISMRMQLINSRAQKIFGADDDNTKLAAEKFLTDLENGKLSAIINKKLAISDQNRFFVTDYDTSNNGRILDSMEFNQYMSAKLLNEIGLQANYNMKRESINGEEAGMNIDSLMPLCDDMLKQREIAIEAINEMFGVDWSVEFSSGWKHGRDLIEAELDQLEAAGDSAAEADAEMPEETPEEKTDEQKEGESDGI